LNIPARFLKNMLTHQSLVLIKHLRAWQM